MFRLAKIWVPPSIFLDLKDDVILCESCMFGTSRGCQWGTKGNKLGSIRRETDNNPGAAVSVDQLQSYQPVLFTQLSGNSQAHTFGPPKYW